MRQEEHEERRGGFMRRAQRGERWGMKKREAVQGGVLGSE